ncbi:MAG: HNH endonuclease, partial [Elusimicrobia bacterium]|nr:HNH endonuclease [Elusimicrobiota bacterium]
MDRRRLAENIGFPSLFEYCVRELRYAHGAAARRIHAARAAAKFPILYRMLERGLLSVTTVSLLAPHLKWDNHRRLVRAAVGKSAREVEALVASLSAAPVAAERVRFVGATPARPVVAPESKTPDLFIGATPTGASSSAPSGVGASVTPDAGQAKTLRVHFSFTADERLFREIERAKELLRHKIPAGRLEDVFEAAILALLDKIDPARRHRRRTGRPRVSAPCSSMIFPRREIPSALRDAVWRRDEGRCVFRSSDGRVCGARAGLQIDHVVPWALGGASSDLRNLRLLCRAHNVLEARRIFGGAAIDAAVARRRGAVEKPSRRKFVPLSVPGRR